MTNNAYVIKYEDKEFTKEFHIALAEWFAEERVNGYERLFIEDISDEEDFVDEWSENYLIIQKELQAKGFTSKDLILSDNTW